MKVQTVIFLNHPWATIFLNLLEIRYIGKICRNQSSVSYVGQRDIKIYCGPSIVVPLQFKIMIPTSGNNIVLFTVETPFL
jgi:hypothetical protein